MLSKHNHIQPFNLAPGPIFQEDAVSVKPYVLIARPKTETNDQMKSGKIRFPSNTFKSFKRN